MAQSLIPKDANHVHRDRTRIFQRETSHAYHAIEGRINQTKDRKLASHVQEGRTRDKSGKLNVKNANKGGIVMKIIEKTRTAALCPVFLVRTTIKLVNTVKPPAFRAKRERTNRVKGSRSVRHVKKVHTKD